MWSTGLTKHLFLEYLPGEVVYVCVVEAAHTQSLSAVS